MLRGLSTLRMLGVLRVQNGVYCKKQCEGGPIEVAPLVVCSFDDFQTDLPPGTRRPKIDSLYDVFTAIRVSGRTPAG